MRDLASFLLGRWHVERSLSEGEEQGSFTGMAEFARDAGAAGAADRLTDRLTWDERGRMRWRGNDLEAFRRLELVRDAAPDGGGGEGGGGGGEGGGVRGAGEHADGWEVRFDDGRPFHALDLSSGVCSAVHPCGEDHYEGEYRILGEDAFEVRWQVRGPRKDQWILSRYRRA
jgi:hypothetical protein